MRKSRFLTALCYLGLGMWLNTSSLNRVAAQSSSLAVPLKSVQNQPHSSNTHRFKADSSAIKVKSSLSLPPISPACPFPSIAMSEAADNALFFGLVGEITLGEGQATSGSTFVPGNGSDFDLGMTVSNLIGAGKLDEALQVAQKIQDVSQKNQALSRIAIAYKEAGQLELAFGVAKRITEPSQSNNTFWNGNISLKDNALSEIVQAYVKAGQLEQALQVAEVMNEGYKVVALLDIAEKYRVAGQSVGAARVIDRAVVAYRTMAKPNSADPAVAVNVRLLILSRFAIQYVAVGQKERAVELSSEIFEVAKTRPQQDFLTLSALSFTTELYASVGQRDKAASVLDYSLKTAKNIKETFLKAFVLAQIANGYALLKQPERVTELSSQALELTKPEKDVSKKSIILIMISRGYGILGQYDKALEVNDVVEPTSLRDQVKQTLACSRKAL